MFTVEQATIIRRTQVECLICHQQPEDCEIRSTTMLFEKDVQVTISAPLCMKCAEETPKKFKEAVANPILRSALKIAGVSMGIVR